MDTSKLIQAAHRQAAEQALTSTKSRSTTPTPAKLYTQPECPDCRGTGVLRYDVPVGHPNFGRVIPCPNDFHDAERLERLSRISGLSRHDLARRLDDIDLTPGNGKALTACREMIDNPTGWLWIWGGPGNAKSEMLIAIVNHLNASGRGPAVYTKQVQILDHMRESFQEKKYRDQHGPGNDLGYIARFKRLLEVPVLAIDEMDKARLTEFALEFRFEFLDERYRQALAGESVTIFASNENPNTLPEPIWDRVRDGRFRVVENRQPSARPRMKRGE